MRKLIGMSRMVAYRERTARIAGPCWKASQAACGLSPGATQSGGGSGEGRPQRGREARTRREYHIPARGERFGFCGVWLDVLFIPLAPFGRSQKRKAVDTYCLFAGTMRPCVCQGILGLKR